MHAHELANHIIEQSTFRKTVYDAIPQGASKILDIGCGNGSLLLQLQRDKGCSQLYGVEMNAAQSAHLSSFLDGLFNVNVEEDVSLYTEYAGFFDYVILHDVVEHLYDPWFTLARIRGLASEHGRLIIATPNLHYWGLQYEILSGRFPYGPGLWHTGHLRWYTPISLLELCLIAGLSVDKLLLELAHRVDFSHLARVKEIKHVQIPPREFQGIPEFPRTFTISYPDDVRRYFHVFYAQKIIADCGRGDLLWDPEPMTYHCPRLQALRKAINLPFDVFNPPAMTPVTGHIIHEHL